MKWFIKVFIALTLFLVGGYNALHSQPYAAYNSHHISLPAKAKLTSLTATENPHADYSNAVSFKAKIRGIIDDDTDDDDDETSSRRQLVGSLFVPQVLSYTSPGYCSNYVAQPLPFRDHYLYTSSSRYLLFNVFRI